MMMTEAEHIRSMIRRAPGVVDPDQPYTEASRQGVHALIVLQDGQRLRVNVVARQVQLLEGGIEAPPSPAPSLDLRMSEDASALDSTALGDALADHLGTSRAEAARRALRAALIHEGLI